MFSQPQTGISIQRQRYLLFGKQGFQFKDKFIDDMPDY